MISSELRIGNYVMYAENILTISSIDKKRAVLDDYNRPLDFSVTFLNQIKPISLTKEWLLKFGFDFSVDTWYLKGVAIWETECCDAKGNEEIGFFYELRDVGMMDMHIKYVHQLQNLYFSLTGQELKIK